MATEAQRKQVAKVIKATVEFVKTQIDAINTVVSAWDPDTTIPTSVELQAEVDNIGDVDLDFGGDDSFAAVSDEASGT